MSQKLCWKCREEYIGGLIHASTKRYIHCHHLEPEVKVTCWCEVDNMDVWKYRKWNYCPKCGKKLEAI